MNPENSQHLSAERLISYKEWLILLIFAALWCIFSTLPYLAGYASQSEDEVFMDFIGRGTPGASGYMMFAQQAQQGHNFFTNQMNPEDVPRAYFSLQWLLFGNMSNWTGLSLIGVFHLWRVLTVFLFFTSAYFLIGLCINNVKIRALALGLMIFGGGLGWVVWILNRFSGANFPVPIDIQGVTLFGYLVNNPHFVRGAAFTILTYACLIVGEKTGKRRFFAYSALAATLHSIVRPYNIPETYLMYLCLPIAFSIQEGRINWGRFTNYALSACLFTPAALYLLLTAYFNPLGMEGWSRQGQLLLPMLLWIGVPFGICILSLIWGGLMPLSSCTNPGILILCLWLLLAWLIENTYPYYPAGHEMSFFAYAIVPSILIFCGPLQFIHTYALKFSSKMPSLNPQRSWVLLVCAIFLLSVPSNAYVYREFFVRLHDPRPPWRYYLSKAEHSALEWLNKNTQADQVVLASLDVSQFIPRLTHNKVFAGHDMITPRYYEKLNQMGQFYREPQGLPYKEWLVNRFKIAYIFHGPYEKKLGSFDPASVPWINKAYDNGDVQIYKVELPTGTT